ncbi:hypothetical protein QBC33DRAFT_520031 [Phialemonium atrogriseum]|uniref:Uncharacterized protein n=1 Tax=Phialemonium atrogriseum TaxID=1093897 RepID=A0AAJ0BRX9_9PEZI|nr:uncharacterized protein QBC33DRAFT_520031 [Phialemonium atrogriseum]KAK1761917.1 hypothetical protein QBC33DRAFT_520031 [Phialemonium atrogriseum]
MFCLLAQQSKPRSPQGRCRSLIQSPAIVRQMCLHRGATRQAPQPKVRLAAKAAKDVADLVGQGAAYAQEREQGELYLFDSCAPGSQTTNDSRKCKMAKDSMEKKSQRRPSDRKMRPKNLQASPLMSGGRRGRGRKSKGGGGGARGRSVAAALVAESGTSKERPKGKSSSSSTRPSLDVDRLLQPSMPSRPMSLNGGEYRRRVLRRRQEGRHQQPSPLHLDALGRIGWIFLDGGNSKLTDSNMLRASMSLWDNQAYDCNCGAEAQGRFEAPLAQEGVLEVALHSDALWPANVVPVYGTGLPPEPPVPAASERGDYSCAACQMRQAEKAEAPKGLGCWPNLDDCQDQRGVG